MQWIQTLGGKKTILTRTLSNQEGDTKQEMQLIGGSISSSIGESIQETGVDLIHLNQIRELKEEEQLIFMQGMRPIKCKKVRYFEHPFFKDKFDENPIEAAKST
jgi:type IV secretion system protein VirD4